MAGIGAREDEITNDHHRMHRSLSGTNVNDKNRSSDRSSREMMDLRSVAALQDNMPTETCQSSTNGTTATKCVTIQQYKEEGAPKYAVVKRYITFFKVLEFFLKRLVDYFASTNQPFSNSRPLSSAEHQSTCVDGRGRSGVLMDGISFPQNTQSDKNEHEEGLNSRQEVAEHFESSRINNMPAAYKQSAEYV